MKMAMLRVGIDTGSGGTHGPLFHDGSFEFIPIPDSSGTEPRTYGNTVGSKGRKLVDYLSKSRRAKMKDVSIHADPEFTTYTYGRGLVTVRYHRSFEICDTRHAHTRASGESSRSRLR